MSVLYVPLTALLAGAGLAFLLCILMVMTKDLHGKFTFDSTIGVQKFHTNPTPRTGGAAMYPALWAACLLSPESVQQIFRPMLLAALPAFAFGIAEDLTKRVGVAERLLATMASGVAAWWLTGVSMSRLDVWGLDQLMTVLPLSVAFTAFAVAGVANAVNIIDGFNGLASGTLIICFLALGLIAQDTDYELAVLCLLLAAVCFGFLIVNFPLGMIFMGDGGAYLMGFLLGWVGVLLPMRNPEISVWTPLLVCAYPVLEVVVSILRRRARQHGAGHADRLHLHSLVKSRYIRKRMGHLKPSLRNAAVSPFMWAYAMLPAVWAVVFRESRPLLIVGFALSFCVYLLIYSRLINFRWCFPKLLARSRL
jgi:UDP-N-acetylmuramyl pentapeptide phosphotransferase/UDP-N-acetylglucosamine-1-phosphate transferase